MTDSRMGADDRLEIAEAVGGIMFHVDRRDWETAVSYLLPEVTTDYTSIFGGNPVRCSREELAEGWRTRLSGFDSKQHTVTQVLVEGSGTRASTVSNPRAFHWFDSDIWAFGGSYYHTLKKFDDSWLVGSLRVQMNCEVGDRSVRVAARRRMADQLGVSIDDVMLIGRSPSMKGT